MSDELTKAEKLSRAMDNVRSGGRDFNSQLAAQVSQELRAQAERIKELEADHAAGLRREKDANERAMKHLRRAEKAEIASKNHAAFSHEWRELAERAEGQRCDAMTPQQAAKVLLDACPNPIFDTLKPKLMGEFSQPYPFFDEDGEEVTANVNISWTVTKDIIAAALRAISEDSQ